MPDPGKIPPGRRLVVEPPAVRQAANEGEVWAPTALAFTAGTLEAEGSLSANWLLISKALQELAS